MTPLTTLPPLLLLTTALAQSPTTHTPGPTRFPGPIIDSTPVPSRFPGPTFFTSYYGTNYWPYFSSHTSEASTVASAATSAAHHSTTEMMPSSEATAASGGTTSATVAAGTASALPAATNGAGGQGAGKMLDMAILMGVGLVGGLVL